MKQFAPPAHAPSCSATPPELVACGVPRAHCPVVAVLSPSSFTVHPRFVSKSSLNTTVLPTAW